MHGTLLVFCKTTTTAYSPPPPDPGCAVTLSWPPVQVLAAGTVEVVVRALLVVGAVVVEAAEVDEGPSVVVVVAPGPADWPQAVETLARTASPTSPAQWANARAVLLTLLVFEAGTADSFPS